ncbi:Hypothetical protein SMAX5B_003082 [Scophthalmus maximus]|uniref:Uncharacterized protein n=1 Tax=Scophthalmus maximus TaxID=52904 RepID=A0A2U9BM38_SCOMX|nr:Hypothetical protein SMAX5B_003082 [Scophthalmus maximus]
MELAVRHRKVSPVGRSVGCGLQLYHQMPPEKYKNYTSRYAHDLAHLVALNLFTLGNLERPHTTRSHNVLGY